MRTIRSRVLSFILILIVGLLGAGCFGPCLLLLTMGSDPVEGIAVFGIATVPMHGTLIDPLNPANCGGTITQWEFYGYAPGGAQLRIFRDAGTHYELVGQSAMEVVAFEDDGHHTFMTSIAVETGDLIGIYFSLGGVHITTGPSGFLLAAGDTGTSPKGEWGEVSGYTLSLRATGTCCCCPDWDPDRPPRPCLDIDGL